MRVRSGMGIRGTVDAAGGVVSSGGGDDGDAVGVSGFTCDCFVADGSVILGPLG